VPFPAGEELPPDDWISQPVADNFLAIATTVITVSQVQADDHGNTPAAASDLEATNVPLPGRIDYAGDIDVFMTTITQTGTLILRLTNLALDMQPKIRIVASDGTTVREEFTPAFSTDQYFFTEVDGNANETLYVEVEHQDPDATTGIYEISMGPSLETGGEPGAFTVYLPLVLRQ
jgi:hypothetical protein